jgi:hypothetical protein
MISRRAFVGVVLAVAACSGPDHEFVPALSGRDRLVTNEYAHWNPHAADAVRSSDWDVTSGSLFVRDGFGWSGVPDAATPNATSSAGTGSSVFRMTTRRHDFLNVAVRLQIRDLRLIGDGRFPPAATDGIHLFLRWQSPAQLYIVSLNRRDGTLVIKKKLRGGSENGGTYATLGQTSYPVRYGVWQPFEVQIISSGSSLVTIIVRQGDRELVRAVDDGGSGLMILQPGSVGIRADNCEFEFRDFSVRQLA